MRRPVVSIVMITYNHEAFIDKSIRGVLSQEVEFPIEFIIAEDCSTDRTLEICTNYRNLHPDIITLITSKQNVGAIQNEYRALSAANGTYIAYCEGDDYWTDPYKLKKQVDFLENNKTFSLTCHRYKIFDKEKLTWNDDGLDTLMTVAKDGFVIDTELFLTKWPIKSLTLVYRRCAFNPELVSDYRNYRDLHLIYHILQFGNGFCMNFEGGVYNKHDKGVHSKIGVVDQSLNALRATQELYKKNKNIVLKKYYINLQRWTIDLLIQEQKLGFFVLKSIFIQFCIKWSLKQFLKNIYHYNKMCIKRYCLHEWMKMKNSKVM